MPLGGRLRIAATRSGEDGQFLDITVTDSGKGIPASEKEKIFEPFHTTKADGTGLGLAIVRRIVEAHAGEVSVDSTEGQGSEFRLRFPMTPEPSTSEQQAVGSRT